jgi:hypothetical protein
MPAIYNSAHGLRSNTEKQQQLGCWYEGRHSRSGSWRGGRGQARPASGRVRAPAPVTCTLRREPERLQLSFSLCACMHACTQANERTDEAKSACASSPTHLRCPCSTARGVAGPRRDSHEPSPPPRPAKLAEHEHRATRASRVSVTAHICQSGAGDTTRRAVSEKGRGFPGARPVSCPSWEGRRVRLVTFVSNLTEKSRE